MSCCYEKPRSQAVSRCCPPLLWSLVIFVLLWRVGASSAQGQNSERTAGDLEKTSQIIEKAQRAVDESGSSRGRMLLENAVRIQQMARERFRTRMFGQARQLTLKAREKAFEAIAATRRTEENVDAVRRQLERTDDLLQNIREKTGERRGPGVGNNLRATRAVWESLSRRQKTAWQHFHERRLRPALKLTLQAREQVMRLTERARRHRHGWENAEQSSERLREFVDRAREPILESGLKKNIEMFERAERRLAQAEEAYQAGQLSVAQEHAKICRELLNRALSDIDRHTDPAEVRQLIDEAGIRWDRLEGAVIDSGNRQLRDLYRRAGGELQRAQSMLQKERMNKALMHARAAVRILNQIEESLP